MTLEAPIKVRLFREQYGISSCRMVAILKAMYPGQARVSFVVPSEVLKFMRCNVTKTTRDFQRMRQESRAA